jgi:hypothetical protein
VLRTKRALFKDALGFQPVIDLFKCLVGVERTAALGRRRIFCDDLVPPVEELLAEGSWVARYLIGEGEAVKWATMATARNAPRSSIERYIHPVAACWGFGISARGELKPWRSKPVPA